MRPATYPKRRLYFRVADIHVSHCQEKKTVLLTRATEERAKTNVFRIRSSHMCLSAGGSCPRRTGHPFSVSGPPGPPQKILFLFSAPPPTIPTGPLGVLFPS